METPCRNCLSAGTEVPTVRDSTWQGDPCRVAIAFRREQKFRRYDSAIDFMENNNKSQLPFGGNRSSDSGFFMPL